MFSLNSSWDLLGGRVKNGKSGGQQNLVRQVLKVWLCKIKVLTGNCLESFIMLGTLNPYYSPRVQRRWADAVRLALENTDSGTGTGKDFLGLQSPTLTSMDWIWT